MRLINKYRHFLEAVFISAAAFLCCYMGLFNDFDSLLKDRLYQTNRGVDNRIRIIAIDERTLEQLGPVSTWSRSVYADTLKNMGDEPSVVAFDIMFFGETDEKSDKDFADACRENGSVITASQILFESGNRVDVDENGEKYINNLKINSVVYPYDELKGVVSSGYANTPSDSDGIVRNALVYVDYDGGELRSLSTEIYSLYCRKNNLAENYMVLDEYHRTAISYAAKPGQYEAVSLCDVYNGTVPKEIFKDCIVLVGAYANGLQDNFKVSNSVSSQMYGVEIHANIVQAYMDGVFPQQVDLKVICVVTAVLVYLVYVLSKQFKVIVSTVMFVGMTGAYILLCAVVYNTLDIICPVVYAPLFFTVDFLINTIRGYWAERLEKKKISDVFKKYVAPQVVDEVTKKGGYTLKLGGENRHIAVLFVDIRGFTPMSESLEPEQVVDILNSYLSLTTNAIFRNGGTLDKFIGDAAMAIFNAPFDLDDYVCRAVCTAMDIVAGGNELEEKFMKLYGKSVGFGIGVNCGNAVVGNIGCEFRMDYTAIGDTVNTAARLESNAKRGQVLISEDVYQAIKSRVTVEDVGEIPLKGKSKGVYVYSVKSLTDRQSNDIDGTVKI